MKRISLLGLLVLLGVGLSKAGAGTPDRSAQMILMGAVAAPSTISYTAVVNAVRIGTSGADASVYRIEHRAPNLTRRIYSAPSDLLGDCVVSKSQVRFTIDPRRRQVVESSDDAADDRIAVAGSDRLMRANYRAALEGAELFDGVQTDDLALVNNYTHRVAMRLKIDRRTKLVIDKREYESNGSLRAEIRLEQVRYVSVAASDFNIPSRYAVVRESDNEGPAQDPSASVRAAGFGAKEPLALPEGFAPVEGDLASPKGVRTVHLLYSDGLRTLSLFESATAAAPDMTKLRPQTASVNGRSAQYAEDGAVALFVWSDGKLHYTLVGELELIELQRIAVAITP